ncbi:MAG: hypothetical protein BJG00_000175 [Limnothrix sp. CACIAM 69d]|nr:MAG: hypothetical protein BJG00_000175 [Limnothrix sp. CACIAM 69d]
MAVAGKQRQLQLMVNDPSQLWQRPGTRKCSQVRSAQNSFQSSFQNYFQHPVLQNLSLISL